MSVQSTGLVAKHFNIAINQIKKTKQQLKYLSTSNTILKEMLFSQNNYQQQIQKLVKQLKNMIKSKVNSEDIDKKIQSIQKILKNMNQQISIETQKYQNTINDLSLQIKQLNKSLQQQKTILFQRNQQWKKFKKQYENKIFHKNNQILNLQRMSHRINQQNYELNLKTNQLEIIINNHKKKINEKQRQIQQIVQKMNKSQKENQSIQRNLNGHISLLTQQKQQKQRIIYELTTKLKTQLNKSQEQIKKRDDTIKQQQIKISTLLQQIDNLKIQIQRIQLVNNQYTNNLNDVKKQILQNPRINKLKNQVKELNDKLLEKKINEIKLNEIIKNSSHYDLIQQIDRFQCFLKNRNLDIQLKCNEQYKKLCRIIFTLKKILMTNKLMTQDQFNVIWSKVGIQRIPDYLIYKIIQDYGQCSYNIKKQLKLSQQKNNELQFENKNLHQKCTYLNKKNQRMQKDIQLFQQKIKNQQKQVNDLNSLLFDLQFKNKIQQQKVQRVQQSQQNKSISQGTLKLKPLQLILNKQQSSQKLLQPYIQFQFLGKQIKSQKAVSINQKKFQWFNNLIINFKHKYLLQINLFNYEHNLKDRLIASNSLNLYEILKKGKLTKCIELYKQHKKICEIGLELSLQK